MKSLFRRYVGALSGLVAAFVLLIGMILSVYHYRLDSQRAAQIQLAESRAAAAAIEEYLKGLERSLHSLVIRGEEGPLLSRSAQAADFRSALRFQPAILNLRAVDRQGRESNFVSRIVPDREASGAPLPWVSDIIKGCRAEYCYGAAFLREQTEPYVTLVVSSKGVSEVLAAELSLRFVNDVLAKLSISESSDAYVVDNTDRLLAHPDLRTLLQHRDVSTLPQVKRLREALRVGERPLPSTWAKSLAGDEVFTSATEILRPHWLVFVEQPATEVLRSVYATIWATAALLALGVLAAFAASHFLARRLAKPILLLRDGAERFGRGDLSTTFDLHTGDEIETVAAAFNEMAGRLRGLYDSLEEKVALRTSELALANQYISDQARELTTLNERLGLQVVELHAKREEADRANAAKTRFLAAASHDLRQPMHAIGLLVGILAQRLAESADSRLLGDIQLSIATLERLFNALLDISQLDAGVIRPSIVPVALKDVLRSVELAHAQDAFDKGLTIDIGDCHWIVLSDEVLLLRILNNLVSNAVRYTDSGSITVLCRPDQDDLVIDVADTGVGIPGDQLEIIFEEFYQATAARAFRTQGLGLGLAIVERTAALLNHPISVRSSVGQGSTFSVRVPIAREAGRPTSTPLAATEEDPLHGAFVIVIDDDRESRLAMQAAFRSWQCHVATSASLGDILLELRNHLRQPDLIVTDYWLEEGQTGLDVIHALRLRAEAVVPSIVLTGDESVIDTMSPLRLMQCLKKPVNLQILRAAATALLGSET